MEIDMTKKMFKLSKNSMITISVICSVIIGIVIIVIGMSYYKYRISELGIINNTDYQEYKYHYAIISKESDEPFWEAVYQGALETGKVKDIYVEKIGSSVSLEYSVKELMKIAIASKVDGIMIEPDEEENLKELINEAEAAGIAVITVIKDVPESDRISFVGINSYNQGKAYAKQVLELVNEGKHKITVLLNSDNMNTSQSVIYSSIIDAVKGYNVEVNYAAINGQSTFSSEEDIRNIIMNAENPPDALVCLTADDTLSAYQAIVDYYKVGAIDIIGYYASDFILQAIDKNIIHSTMTIDAKQMGAYCVNALTEYRETGRVSDYYSVNINVVNAGNVAEYQKIISSNETE